MSEPTLTVLVIDDDADIRRIVELTLRRLAGWRVLLASSVDEALVSAFAERPDVLLVDLQMPGLTGADLLTRLASETATLPCILMTAKPLRREERERLLQQGAAGLLPKPFDHMVLPGEVRRLVATFRARRT